MYKEKPKIKLILEKAILIFSVKPKNNFLKNCCKESQKSFSYPHESDFTLFIFIFITLGFPTAIIHFYSPKPQYFELK